MTVLVSNHTPYAIWRTDGGLVGACRTIDQAYELMGDLKKSFPTNNYICTDPDGSVLYDTSIAPGASND